MPNKLFLYPNTASAVAVAAVAAAAAVGRRRVYNNVLIFLMFIVYLELDSRQVFLIWYRKWVDVVGVGSHK